jgi:uncharacterized RDD family membrane protein YckC
MSRLTIALVVVALSMTAVAASGAQDPRPQAPAPPTSPLPPERPARPEPPAPPDLGGPVFPETPFPARWPRPVFRIGSDYVLMPNDEAYEAVVIYGDATIEGRITNDVFVLFGQARIASTAVIGGALVVIGGRAEIASGATVDRDLVIIASTYEAPPEFSAGGDSMVIGNRTVGGAIEALVPWITRGLLWGRPLVPSLPWVWGLLAIVFVLYLTLNLLFDRSVRACATTLAERPFTSLAVGILIMLLTGPVFALLGVSLVGIPVIPFVFVALIGAWLVGRVAVARWIGMSAVPEESPDNRLHATRSFVIGFVVISLAYMLPIVGFAAWAMVGVLGLGSAGLAFLSAYRREHPPKPRKAAAVPPPPVEPADAPVASSSPALQTDSIHQASAISQASIPPTYPTHPTDPTRQAAATYPTYPTDSHATYSSDLTSYPRASLKDRAVAAVLDLILVIIAANLLAPILPTFRNDEFRSFLFLLLAYHVGFWASKGTTVGGIITQLRIVRTDGTGLRFADALVRALGSVFSVAVVGLGFYWITRDPERQAWHDRIAGTYVVKVPRDYPI